MESRRRRRTTEAPWIAGARRILRVENLQVAEAQGPGEV